MPVASQMQVAAAASAVTGAPLHVATPMALPQFISPYSQAHPSQPYQPFQQVSVLDRTQLIKIAILSNKHL